jgi:geranylgeranyl diphosphate synthase type II
MTYPFLTYLPMVEDELASHHFPPGPDTLYDPIRYFLNLPGKRIRPIFVLQCLELFRDPDRRDVLAALSTEWFHNFSLVHDDIMDNADKRRGFPTVHQKWDTPTALLAGDAMLVVAYQALLSSDTPDLKALLSRFNGMALAVCEGQQLDMDFSTKDYIPVEDYLDMIDRKTGALIAFCFELAGFLGHASGEERIALSEFGMAMGRCFQLRDDYLDLFAPEEITGKKQGGDIANSKLTYPILMSLSLPGSADFRAIWDARDQETDWRISRALDWMVRHEIPSITEKKIEEEMARGMDLLSLVNGREEARQRIRELCTALACREK